MPATDLAEATGPDAPAEPLITVSTITAFASAVVAIIVVFGVKLDSDQRAAVLGIVGIAAPVVVGVWGRTKVFSPATVGRLMRDR